MPLRFHNNSLYTSASVGLLEGVGGIEHAHLRRRFIGYLQHQPTLLADRARQNLAHIIAHARLHMPVVRVVRKRTFDGALTPLMRWNTPAGC